jgi:hypothetical protein
LQGSVANADTLLVQLGVAERCAGGLPSDLAGSCSWSGSRSESDGKHKA